jgi:hypothetical protein
LKEKLETAHQVSLERGMSVSLNGISLKFEPTVLLNSKQLQPASYDKSFFRETGTPVRVQIYAGIAESKPF